jgi:hypothetical protein
MVMPTLNINSMKKLLLLLLLVPCLVQGQVYRNYFSVVDSTKYFNIKLPAHQMLLDETSGIWYRLDSATTSIRKKLSQATVYKTALSGAAYTAGTGITLSGTTFSSTYWADVSSAVTLSTTYKALGVGALAPLHKFVVVGTKVNTPASVGTAIPMFNYVNGNINTNRATIAQATDTSALSLNYTYYTGKPTLLLKGNTGNTLFQIDTAGAISLYSAGTGISISGNTMSGNYVAGLGITLSTNTFSHTAHTGDVTGTTSLTVGALMGRSLSTIIPTIGNVLKWDGTYWYPVAP